MPEEMLQSKGVVGIVIETFDSFLGRLKEGGILRIQVEIKMRYLIETGSKNKGILKTLSNH